MTPGPRVHHRCALSLTPGWRPRGGHPVSGPPHSPSQVGRSAFTLYNPLTYPSRSSAFLPAWRRSGKAHDQRAALTTLC